MDDEYFGSHEFQAREHVVAPSSDRSFGLVFAGFCVLISALSIYNHGQRWPIWSGLAVLLAVVALTIPRVLAPLNRLWLKFGLLLHMVISPIILGLIFYACILPIGLLMRFFGKAPLRLHFEPEATSYWIHRKPPGPQPESFKNQF
jgi:Saxitoxin biosynthesis operon protein SxtJ